MSDKESSAGEERAIGEARSDVPLRPAGPITGVWVDEMSDKPDAQPTPRTDSLICPACAHQFQAISEDHQEQLRRTAQPIKVPNTKNPAGDAVTRSRDDPPDAQPTRLCTEDGKPCPPAVEGRGPGNCACEQNGICQRVDMNNLPRLQIEIDAQPTPNEYRCTDSWGIDVVAAEWADYMIAAKDAELAAANKAVIDYHDRMLAERTARLEAEREHEERVRRLWAMVRAHETAADTAEQRLAAVEAQLAGVVERCAKVCDDMYNEQNAASGVGTMQAMVAYQLARAIRALTAAPKKPVELAQRFHDTYERLAPQFGYETRKDTRQFDPESPNGKLMIAVCREIYAQPDEKADVVDALRGLYGLLQLYASRDDCQGMKDWETNHRAVEAKRIIDAARAVGEIQAGARVSQLVPLANYEKFKQDHK